jgi:hypothetical protein
MKSNSFSQISSVDVKVPVPHHPRKRSNVLKFNKKAFLIVLHTGRKVAQECFFVCRVLVCLLSFSRGLWWQKPNGE